MARKILVVVDMQKDFIYGSLGTPEARSIVGKVIEKVREFDGEVIFTQDTHHSNYLETQEGKLLPVEHCMAGSDGWKLVDELEEMRQKAGWSSYQKGTFGCARLALDLQAEHARQPIEAVEAVGVCTDICVVSNALLIKAYLPEVPVIVHAGCCAGVTPEKHEAALETMRSCQITVK